MPVFISYSHSDSRFAERLARQLVAQNVHVWIDRWELRVGDSLIDRIEQAVDGASALLVVLSNASVASEWCRKELKSGLLRELEERRVVVLPLLIEDCEIPLFLREKLYADFRTDFDRGLRDVLEGVASVTNAYLARQAEPDFHTDWSIDWYSVDEQFCIRCTFVEQAVDQPYTVLTEMTIALTDEAKARYDRIERISGGDAARTDVIQSLAGNLADRDDLRLILDDQFEKTVHATFFADGGEMYVMRLSSRRLGEDTGKDILVNRSTLIAELLKHMRQVFKGTEGAT